jgi:geranyl-CoA carboxylase alpha subunit
LAAARRSGADAIHPGYGFLSENPQFAQACVDAGLVFIGPPASAMQAMGDKARAKARMQAAGVPCVPGYLGEDQSDQRLSSEAQELGFPLLVKAVAGGGGRGMRLVRQAEDLPQALVSARREAESAFGDDRLMLERLIENARHIEIQVFADSHGNTLHLGERDCTAQRRRQKVIEESPSPVVGPTLRERMGHDAVAAARAASYVGAGTVEFIVDSEFRHYFLEMNTRLQVEHPVTEMVTGLDLVEWQLRVAAGEPLPLAQSDVRYRGHAIEARLYAEDPYSGFSPQTGRVLRWRPDRVQAQGVRVDSGIEEGADISPWYDPMVAKLVVHGQSREEATRRLRHALLDAPLLGLRTNARFLVDLLGHQAFREASMSTSLIDQWQETAEPLMVQEPPDQETWCLAAAILALQSGDGWRADSVAAFDMTLQWSDTRRALRVRPGRGAEVTVGLDGDLLALRLTRPDDGQLRFEIEGLTRTAEMALEGERIHLAVKGHVFVFAEVSPFPQANRLEDPGRIRSPVAGKVTQVQITSGDRVLPGQALVCVEAMKMEMWLTARAAGRVSAVHVTSGSQVPSAALLVEIALD